MRCSGIAFQTAMLIDAMEAGMSAPMKELRVDGGASASDFLMQFQADILNIPVIRPSMVETTAAGRHIWQGWPRESRRTAETFSGSAIRTVCFTLDGRIAKSRRPERTERRRAALLSKNSLLLFIGHGFRQGDLEHAPFFRGPSVHGWKKTATPLLVR